MRELEAIVLGKIRKPIALCLGIKEGIKIYFLSEDLDRFARSYPDSYLSKIHECKSIIKYPLYGAYSEKRHRLYLMKEYIVEARFIKVGIAIEMKEQGYLREVFVLNNRKAEEIFEEGAKWLLITQKEKASS